MCKRKNKSENQHKKKHKLFINKYNNRLYNNLKQIFYQ